MMLIKLDAEGVDYLEWRYAPGETAEIVDIKVRSQRVRGKGRSMVEQLLRHLRSNKEQPVKLLYAFSRQDNDLATGFYTALGFVRLAALPRFYAESAAVLWGYYL